MSKFKKIFVLLLLALFFPLNFAQAEQSIKFPEPTEYKYVNDYANILDSGTEQNIISVGQELYTKTKAEVVVVTIDNLPEGYDRQRYANELFREWGIGDKKLNNGILLLVAYKDRKLQIEVGYGLEGAVPDAIANRIVDETIIPRFKNDDYNSGVLRGYYELCNQVADEYDVTLSGQQINVRHSNQDEKRSNLPIIIAVLLFLGFDGIFLRWRMVRFIFYIMASSRPRRGGGGRGGFGGFGGGSGGGLGGFGGGSSGGGGAGGDW